MMPGMTLAHLQLWNAADLTELPPAALVGYHTPHAARNIKHFLGNTGRPLDQDVDQLLVDLPSFAEKVAKGQDDLGRLAVKRAQRVGSTQPITFPVNTKWKSFNSSRDEARSSPDWYNALGSSFTYNQTGQVTVRPPVQVGGPWRYDVSTRVNLRDPYDFDDRNKIDHKLMIGLHQWGFARDFLAYGASDRLRRTG